MVETSIRTSIEEKLRSYLIDLITHFREKMKNLSVEEQNAAQRTFEDLSPPCQIMVIWAKEPEFQIVILAHLKELEDKSIEIHGPIENSNLLDYIESEVLNSHFVKLIGKERVEGFLASFLRHMPNFYDPLRGLPKPHIIGRARLGLDEPYVVGWLIIGNLLNFNVEEVANDCIKSIVSTAKPTSSVPAVEEKVILEGFGTYLYPPVWIGEIPKPKSFKEKIMGRPLWIHSSERVITEKYKQYPLIMTRDGYISIGTKEKPKALELLNEIMSTLLLLGVPIHVIRELDLGEALFKERGESKTWSPISLRAWLYKRTLYAYSPLTMGEITVEEEKMKKAIRLSEVITSDEKIKTLASLFLEAHTYFMNTEYKQAFVIGWVILEDFYIKDLWLSQVSKITSDKDRLSKIGSWSVDQKLEALNISHVIPNEEFSLLMEIKDSRNEVVHEGKTPKKETVEKCLELISKVVRKYIGEHIGTMLPKL